MGQISVKEGTWNVITVIIRVIYSEIALLRKMHFKVYNNTKCAANIAGQRVIQLTRVLLYTRMRRILTRQIFRFLSSLSFTESVTVENVVENAVFVQNIIRSMGTQIHPLISR